MWGICQVLVDVNGVVMEVAVLATRVIVVVRHITTFIIVLIVFVVGIVAVVGISVVFIHMAMLLYIDPILVHFVIIVIIMTPCRCTLN